MYIDNALRLGNIKLDKQMLPIGIRLQVWLTVQGSGLGIKSPLRRGNYWAGVREFTIEMLGKTMNDVAYNLQLSTCAAPSLPVAFLLSCKPLLGQT